MRVEPSDALIVVDVQNDFCPGGALAVDEGDRVAPVINQVMPLFEHVVFTRDWHPADHCSFAAPPEFTDGSWPAHCVANSPGAEFHGDLNVPADAIIINKGMDPNKEAYSGFSGTSTEAASYRPAADLARQLRKRGVLRVFVCGLATEYCVKQTALDGLKNGFRAALIENACRGVNYPPGSAAKAVEEMRTAGVEVHWSRDLE